MYVYRQLTEDVPFPFHGWHSTLVLWVFRPATWPVMWLRKYRHAPGSLPRRASEVTRAEITITNGLIYQTRAVLEFFLDNTFRNRER